MDEKKLAKLSGRDHGHYYKPYIKEILEEKLKKRQKFKKLNLFETKYYIES